MSDQVLESGVSAIVARCESRGQLHDEQAELLISDIHSVAIKVSFQIYQKLWSTLIMYLFVIFSTCSKLCNCWLLIYVFQISSYLVCRNVSSAYILAARHERTNDLRRVLQEAERLANEQVRSACLKRLTSKNVL